MKCIGGKRVELNHCAFRVSGNAFDFVVALFTERLGFRVLRRLNNRTVWMRQGEIPVDIQICASATTPETKWLLGRFFCAGRFPWRKTDKFRSQISFLSDEPEKELRKLGTWIESMGYKPLVRAFSDEEFFLDVPGVFVDFIIEAMTPDCADYGE
ncbi:MAG: hypothetical protein JW852_00745 [Spirochaetales bacterium]|nr:hypothetical protein [Spirochaetales bacterium]